MNNIKNIVFTFLAVVGVHFVAMAQTQDPPPPGDFGGSLDGNATDTPIDTFIWTLLLVGLVYVFYKYRSLKSKVS